MSTIDVVTVRAWADRFRQLVERDWRSYGRVRDADLIGWYRAGIAPEDAALVFLREGRELGRFPQRGLS